MTVVAAAVTADHGVVMAADRQLSGERRKLYHATPKLWTAGRFLLGASGDWRTVQVVKHHTDWPGYAPAEAGDLERFLVRRVVPAVRAATKDQGVVLKSDQGKERLFAWLLWACGDELAMVEDDGCVTVEAGRTAVGLGAEAALGRLGRRGPWTRDDVVDAVRQAEYAIRGCSGPISVADTRTLTIEQIEE